MNRLALLADRLRLAAEIWLRRHGPWWLLLAVLGCSLLGLAMVVIPRLEADLAGKQAILEELRAIAASGPEPTPAPVSPSESHYEAFRETLAAEDQVRPSIQAILDAAAAHRLLVTRAEYLPGHDAKAQVDTLQMILPVKGRYPDVRRWIEEILATQPYTALNELGFKREEIGINQIEARVRLTLWLRPAGAADGGRSIDP